MSADNQQERLNAYIAGFVDGEGSFHIAIHKASHVKFGYQLIPEFHVSQNLDYSNILELIKLRLDCGYIKPNHANNLNDRSYVFVVRNRNDLLHKVIPFFKTNQLYSPKHKDFEKFSYIVNAMNKNIHTTYGGFIELVNIAFSMNRNGQYRKMKLENIIEHLKSSTTIR